MANVKKYIAGMQRRYVYDREPHIRYKTSRMEAKRRGLPFTIPYAQYVRLIAMPCHYCGNIYFNCGVGLDRIHNDRGYTIDNVMPCCFTCNVLRGGLNKDVFVDVVVRIYNNLRGRVPTKSSKTRIPKGKKTARR